MSTEDVHFQNVAKRFHELMDTVLANSKQSSEEEREMEDICTIMDAFEMRNYKPVGGIDDMYRRTVVELKGKVVKIKENLGQKGEQLSQYERHRLDAVNYFLME